ncbi:hypothetical protein MMC25_008213 [Agyrium rufum]|nr:hypothetical protein [Agyrium rufum]
MTRTHEIDPTHVSTTPYQHTIHQNQPGWPAQGGPDLSLSTTPHALTNPVGFSDQRLRDDNFTALLQQCVKFQGHIGYTRYTLHWPVSNGSVVTPVHMPIIPIEYLQQILGEVDYSCNFISGIYCQDVTPSSEAQPDSRCDYASAALVTALILKIFEVCHIALDSGLLKAGGSETVLLRKRLDSNIAQAKVVSVRIQKSTSDEGPITSQVVKLAADLEEKLVNP